jgi:CheY-like chemotaxis protein
MPISQYLRDCGYKVIEAANADEAMTVLLHKETVIDIVFTDIEMPGTLDGFGLARWVRDHRPGVDVILAGTLPRTVEQAKELCGEGPIPSHMMRNWYINESDAYLPRGKEQSDQIEG